MLGVKGRVNTFEEFRRGCSEFFNWIWLVSHFPIVKIGLVCIEIHKVKIRKFVFRIHFQEIGAVFRGGRLEFA
ncbi:hypothetical protein ACOSP7_008399 [Xanthoceras sorbifolium]